MKFTKLQLASIYRFAILMASADGRLDENEKKHVAMTIVKLAKSNGVETDDIFKYSDDIEDEDAITSIVLMSKEQKMYVVAFFGVLVAIDNDVNEREMSLFNIIASMCGYKGATLDECFNVWKQLK